MIKTKKVSVEDIKNLKDVDPELSKELFNTVTVKVPIFPLLPGEDINNNAGEDKYSRKNAFSVGDLYIEDDYDLKSFKRTKNIVDTLNESIHDYDKPYTNSWSPFYLIKEFLQRLKFEAKEFDFFYRGQSSNWELFPSSFRNTLNDDYKEKFDNEYHKISMEYEDISYVPLAKGMRLEDSEKRARNIAYLQHFGMPTPFTDITSSEFISMYFMINNNDKKISGIADLNKISPSLDIIFCPDDVEWSDTLIQYVPKDSQNVRMSAQSGLFLDFEKIIKLNAVAPLNRIRITFEYSIKNQIENILSERNFDDDEQMTHDKEIYKNFADDLSSGLLSESESYINNLKMDMDNLRNEIINMRRNRHNTSIREESLVERETWMNKYQTLENERDVLRNQLRFIKRSSNEVNDNFSKAMRDKLSEFGYSEKEIFPDLQHKLQGIAKDYTKKDAERRLHIEI